MFAGSPSAGKPCLVLGLAFGLSIVLPAAPALAAAPELPRSYVDTTYVAPTGATLFVAAGGNLQAALDAAQPGDVITLQAGATFTGSYTLPVNPGTGWVIVRTSAPDSSLPAAGTRIAPSDASVLPKIVSPDSRPAIRTAPGAHHFRFIGIEFAVAAGVTLSYGIVQLGDGSSAQSSLSQVPHHIILDRVYIHGNPTGNVRRGVSLNSAWTAVIDSYISDIHAEAVDSQAMGCWNGPGPFKIVNNHLEASTENVMFGGADPYITNLVPSDIEIRGNHFFKPLSWRIGDQSYAGIPWPVKNLFELKNAQRVLVDGNIFENNWLHAQNGFAILFTVRNQDGTAPWSVVQDVTFTRNIVRHSASAINILGQDDNYPSQQTRRILLKGNLFEDVDGTRWGGDGRLFQILDGAADVVIDHNTAFQANYVIMADGGPSPGFVYNNNLTPNNQYGVGGTGTTGNPLLTLATFFPGALFGRNVLMGGNASSYPPTNFFPASWSAVGFVDFASRNYQLAATSPYKAAGTDGQDIGADIDAIQAATAGAISGGGSSPSDTTPPVISAVGASSVTSSGAAITWVTSEASDSQVEYGPTTAYGATTPLDAALLASHSQTLIDLASATLYHYRVKSRDAASNLAVSADFTFTTAPASRAPYYGVPFAVPGLIEAEDFDRGGEGVAYHDLVAGNQGGLYRTSEDVDIVSPYAGGSVVNNFQAGEWLEYTIVVSEAGVYRLEALASSALSGSRWHMEVDGVNVTGPVTVPNTGSWATFQWTGADGVSLAAGPHVLRIFSEVEYFNLDALRTVVSDTTPDGSPGRIAYLKLDEGSGTMAGDSSGNGNGGSLRNGAGWTAGHSGHAVALDGENDYVRIPHTTALDAYPLSVAVWFKTSTTTGVRALVNKYLAGSRNGYQVFLSSGSLCAMYFKNASSYVYDVSGCPLAAAGYNDGQWHQAVFVVDASGGRLYVDGAQKAGRAWTGAAGAPTTTREMRLGHYQGGSSSTAYLPGAVDDLQVYNRALSADEVLALYAIPPADTPVE